MSRLLTLMMILVLVMAHGSSVAAAICHHQDGVEHAVALQSYDAGVSAAANSEESAAKAGLRKGAPADSGAASSPADLLPSPVLPLPFRAKEPAKRNPADPPALAGVSMRPLLEPPSA